MDDPLTVVKKVSPFEMKTDETSVPINVSLYTFTVYDFRIDTQISPHRALTLYLTVTVPLSSVFLLRP